MPEMALLALLVALGLWFGLYAGLSAPRAHAQENVGSYTVVAGDTLFEIAQRFGVSLDALVALNNIQDPSLIRVGQVLLIPGASHNLAAIPTTLVQTLPGDTLALVAQRYNQDINLLTSLNNVSATTRLFPGQTVRLPADQAPPPLRFGAVREILWPAQLVQGRTGRLTIITERPLDLTADWNGLPLTFLPADESGVRYFTFLPVPALLGPGLFPLTVTYTAGNGEQLSRQQLIPVADGGYDSQIIELPPDRASLLDPTLVTSETAKVVAVWSQVSPTLWWREQFWRPIADQYRTTSPFGTRRSYNGGPFNSYHAGQDFGAPAGVTVTAPAAGIVALAEPLLVRGNAILLDHGHGVFTGYWHLSELRVAPGQQVAAGDLLGLVGNTGLSTGAHLHWEMRISGVAVDPMQFLDEPLAPPE
ncbi:MAG: M23 family peptidase [Chloroflexi bacterium]|nr:MAG: M23 family peptidase [Chloroflexota bacterium]